jgi:hypothetical protein
MRSRIPKAMTENGNFLRLIAAAVLAAALAGCTTAGGTSDDKMGRFLVAPDKFTLYNCAQLADAAQANIARQRELEMLMTKAEPDAGGPLVSAVAYRPEYAQMRGEMNELRKTAAEKNCKSLSGAEIPGGRTSDMIVH